MPRVVIYRSTLLPVSETFIADHLSNLVGWEGCLAGFKRVEGLPIPEQLVTTQAGFEPSKVEYLKYLAAPARSRLFQKIAELKPDLIHAHFAVDAVEALPMAQKLGIPLLVTLHGYDVTSSDWSHLRSTRPSRLNYMIRRGSLKRGAALFLPVSSYMSELALSQGFPATRMRSHHLGIDPKRFAKGSPLTREGILFVGRLVEKKGASFLLMAAEKLKSMGIEEPITIIGDGPDRQTLENLARKLGLSVNFLGAQPHDVVAKAMHRAKLFCMPSTRAANGDNEGFGLVYIEAQASGLPVVAFNQGPVSSAVSHGETGLLARDKDVDDLAASLSRLLTNEALRLRFSAASERYVAQNFDIRVQSRTLELIYDEVLMAGSVF